MNWGGFNVPLDTQWLRSETVAARRNYAPWDAAFTSLSISVDFQENVNEKPGWSGISAETLLTFGWKIWYSLKPFEHYEFGTQFCRWPGDKYCFDWQVSLVNIGRRNNVHANAAFKSRSKREVVDVRDAYKLPSPC